jgi:hypothetical protein
VDGVAVPPLAAQPALPGMSREHEKDVRVAAFL